MGDEQRFGGLGGRAGRTGIVLSLLLAAALLPRVAGAQVLCPDPVEPEADRAAAAETFAEGESAARGDDLRSALEWFECSYGLSPERRTLHAIGRAHASLGERDAARRVLTGYLELYPDADDRAEVEALLAGLEERPAPDPGVARPEPEPPEPDGPVAPVVEAPATRMTVQRRAAWGTLAAGIALLAGGGGLMGGAAAINSDFVEGLEQTDPDMAELQDLRDRGLAFQTGGWVLLGLGTAAVAASVALFAAFPGREATAVGTGSRAPTPVLAWTGSGLSVSGTF